MEMLSEIPQETLQENLMVLSHTSDFLQAFLPAITTFRMLSSISPALRRINSVSHLPDNPLGNILRHSIIGGDLACNSPQGKSSFRVQIPIQNIHTADALLAVPQTPEEKSAFDDAKEFLLEVLSGGMINANEIFKEARRAGISEKTLKRAKKALAVRSEKSQFGGGWIWRLPDEEGQESPKGVNKNIWASSENLAPFGENDQGTPPQKDNNSEVLNILEVTG